MIAHQWTLEGRPVDIPTYDYVEHTRSSKTYRQEPQGCLHRRDLSSEDKRLLDLMDGFVDTDDDVRIIRRIKRDMEERGRSLDSVIEHARCGKPMQQFIWADAMRCDHSWGRDQHNAIGFPSQPRLKILNEAREGKQKWGEKRKSISNPITIALELRNAQ